MGLFRILLKILTLINGSGRDFYGPNNLGEENHTLTTNWHQNELHSNNHTETGS